MLVAGLALVHSTVLKLKVGKADLSGRDSPSEGPTWKDPDYVRERENTMTVEFTVSPHCFKVKGKAHLRDQTRTLLNSERASCKALPLPAVLWPKTSALDHQFPVKSPHRLFKMVVIILLHQGAGPVLPSHRVICAYSEAQRKTRSPQ